jgi:hypothetical protein
VRERVYVDVRPDEVRAGLAAALKRELAYTTWWLDYRVAATTDGAVVEIVEPPRQPIVLLIVRWLPTLCAVLFACVAAIARLVGGVPDLTFVFAVIGVAIAFQAVTRLQALIVTPLASQAIRELFGQVRVRPAREVTGPSARV